MTRYPRENSPPPGTLQRFGTRTAPNPTKAHGSHPQSGLLYKEETLTTPYPDVKETIMGLTPGDTAT